MLKVAREQENRQFILLTPQDMRWGLSVSPFVAVSCRAVPCRVGSGRAVSGRVMSCRVVSCRAFSRVCCFRFNILFPFCYPVLLGVARTWEFLNWETQREVKPRWISTQVHKMIGEYKPSLRYRKCTGPQLHGPRPWPFISGEWGKWSVQYVMFALLVGKKARRFVYVRF